METQNENPAVATPLDLHREQLRMSRELYAWWISGGQNTEYHEAQLIPHWFNKVEERLKQLEKLNKASFDPADYKTLKSTPGIDNRCHGTGMKSLG